MPSVRRRCAAPERDGFLQVHDNFQVWNSYRILQVGVRGECSHGKFGVSRSKTRQAPGCWLGLMLGTGPSCLQKLRTDYYVHVETWKRMIYQDGPHGHCRTKGSVPHLSNRKQDIKSKTPRHVVLDQLGGLGSGTRKHTKNKGARDGNTASEATRDSFN